MRPKHYFKNYSSILVAFSWNITIFSTENRNKNYYLQGNEDLTRINRTTDHLENYLSVLKLLRMLMLTDTFLLSKYSELLTVLKRENCEKSFKKFV